MSFVDGLSRLVHIAAAMAWFGGALLLVTRIMPIMKRAGDRALDFQFAMGQYGGLGVFFAISSTLTWMAGGHLYGAVAKPHLWEMGANRMMLDVGVAVGTMAWLLGIYMGIFIERKMTALARSIDGEPTPAQVTLWRSLMGRLELTSRIMLGLVAVAVVGMAGRQMLA